MELGVIPLSLYTKKTMDNRFFSLLIVPDSGSDVKTGSFNFRYVLGFLCMLVAVFFICLFFIIGYHIKLSQEKNYKRAVSANKSLLEHIDISVDTFNTLSEKLTKLQQNDRYFRLFQRMDVLDNDMYQAGIGGHVIVDNTKYAEFGQDLQIQLSSLDYGLITLDNRIGVLGNSLEEIHARVRRNREMIDYTPSILPTHSFRFTSNYGYRTHPITKRRHFHGAVDLGGYRGQDIFATADGVVKSAGRQGPLGNCIKIEHKYGYETLYAHLDKIQVKAGDKIKKNDRIGLMGSTGTTTGVHLHYSVALNGRAQNPMDYFK